MVQFALIFVLGLLVATFVAALILPSVWRRGQILARRHIEVELPVSLTEIRADQDALRAEYAVQLAKSAQQLKQARTRVAEQETLLARQQSALTHAAELEAQSEQAARRLAELGQAAEQSQSEIARLKEAKQQLAAQLKQSEASRTNLENLNDAFRIEVGGYEAQIARHLSELNESRRVRKEQNGKIQEFYAQVSSLQAELKGEKHRSSELETKLQKLISRFSDAEEKLSRLDRKS